MFPSVEPLAQIGSSVVVCAAFAVVLFGREGLDLALEALAKLKLKRAGNTSVAEPAAENTAPDEELVSSS